MIVVYYGDKGSFWVGLKWHGEFVKCQQLIDAIFENWREVMADDPFPKWGELNETR